MGSSGKSLAQRSKTSMACVRSYVSRKALASASSTCRSGSGSWAKTCLSVGAASACRPAFEAISARSKANLLYEQPKACALLSSIAASGSRFAATATRPCRKWASGASGATLSQRAIASPASSYRPPARAFRASGASLGSFQCMNRAAPKAPAAIAASNTALGIVVLIRDILIPSQRRHPPTLEFAAPAVCCGRNLDAQPRPDTFGAPRRTSFCCRLRGGVKKATSFDKLSNRPKPRDFRVHPQYYKTSYELPCGAPGRSRQRRASINRSDACSMVMPDILGGVFTPSNPH